MKFLILAFLVSFVTSILIIKFHNLHEKFTTSLHDGPQKIHKNPTPRIGGLGIFLGFATSNIYSIFINPQQYTIVATLLITSTMVFLLGFLEDITNKVSVKIRLLFICLAAIISIQSLNLLITNLGLPFINQVLTFLLVTWLFTSFAIVGLTNAYNIIDGLNGLASMVGIISLIAITYISLKLNDYTIMTISLTLIGAIFGFFLWNYPKGFIFLGDGGAYFIGFNVAILSILLINRHNEISPWFALLINAYPIFETMFTMWRRKFYKGKKVGDPDRSHLHSILFRRSLQQGFILKKNYVTNLNSRTSIYLWVLTILATVPAVLWWDNTITLASFFMLFCISYIQIYRSIILFKTWRWFK